MKRGMALILALAVVGCGGDSGNQSQSNGDAGSGSGGRIDGMFSSDQHRLDADQLRRLAIGIHNFHDTTRRFPFDGQSNKINRHQDLSWRVSILAYLEKMKEEFDKFDISQPWDSDQNKPLIMEGGQNLFTLSNGNLVCTIKHKEPITRMSKILDGVSNTIMLMENPRALGDQWTQPVDITPEEAVKLVKSLKKGEFVLCALFDGSCRKLYSTEGKRVKDEEIRALFGHNDGMAIDTESFFRSN